MIFYIPYSQLNRSLNIGERLLLPEDEAQHAVKVLRLQQGHSIEIVDGKGSFYNAVITNPHHKRCEIEITNCQTEYEKRDFYLHIAIAPTKNIERLEWFVEKATEIGIDEITPILCRFSERKILKEERLEKIMISAMKQSKKAYLPKLNPLQSFEKFVASSASATASFPEVLEGNVASSASTIAPDTEAFEVSNQYIAHCYENNEKNLLQNLYKKGESALILIGPEGDFSQEEVEFAIKNGFQPVSLGNSRLRTETAGIVACHTVSITN